MTMMIMMTNMMCINWRFTSDDRDNNYNNSGMTTMTISFIMKIRMTTMLIMKR